MTSAHEAHEDHPRDRFALDRIDLQAQAFEEAWERGRLHHAWLLIGPQGLGKASFAFRAARRLLGAASDLSYGPLGSSPHDPVSRLMSSQSHPDFIVLDRSADNAKKVIPVDEARRLPEFFAKAPALGTHRVAIIDAVDDLNANGANAVLKTLEEPSENGVLFLISHAPGRLLPTIRSRCRTLMFRPWPLEALQSEIEAKTGVGPVEAALLATMAKGSPGRVAGFMKSGVAEMDRAAKALVEGADALPRPALMTVSEMFRGGEGALRFSFFLERVMDAVHHRAKASDPATGSRWAELWEKLSSLPGRVEGLNLDRADAFWSVVTEIQIASRVQ